MPPVDEPVGWPLWKVTEGPLVAGSALSNYPDCRLSYNRSTIQSGTRSYIFAYSSCRPEGVIRRGRLKSVIHAQAMPEI